MEAVLVAVVVAVEEAPLAAVAGVEAVDDRREAARAPPLRDQLRLRVGAEQQRHAARRTRGSSRPAGSGLSGSSSCRPWVGSFRVVLQGGQQLVEPLEALAPELAVAAPASAVASRSGSARRWLSRTVARRLREISPACSSTFRCRETAGWDIRERRGELGRRSPPLPSAARGSRGGSGRRARRTLRRARSAITRSLYNESVMVLSSQPRPASLSAAAMPSASMRAQPVGPRGRPSAPSRRPPPPAPPAPPPASSRWPPRGRERPLHRLGAGSRTASPFPDARRCTAHAATASATQRAAPRLRRAALAPHSQPRRQLLRAVGGDLLEPVRHPRVREALVERGPGKRARSRPGGRVRRPRPPSTSRRTAPAMAGWRTRPRRPCGRRRAARGRRASSATRSARAA